MIDFLICSRRRKLRAALVKAFPKEYEDDVKFISGRLALNTRIKCDTMYSKEKTEWILLSGEKIKIPYRIYLKDNPKLQEKLQTARQKTIYNCILSRSYDGYVREKHIKALLEGDPWEWIMPYIVKICDEYIVEILQAVYDSLRFRNCEKYREFCKLNLKYLKLGHSRMISYWNAYYRNEYYKYDTYIGKKLYKECFGYRKTG